MSGPEARAPKTPYNGQNSPQDELFGAPGACPPVEQGSDLGYCRTANPVERQSFMPSSWAATRRVALALLGLGLAPAFAPAFAQGGNVTAFNPYSGVGLP